MMVYEYGSSESDEERHDRFRSERGQIQTAGSRLMTSKTDSKICSKCNSDSRLHCRCYSNRHSYSSQRSQRHRTEDRVERSDSRRKNTSEESSKCKRKCKRNEIRDKDIDRKEPRDRISSSSPQQNDEPFKSEGEGKEKRNRTKTDSKENRLNLNRLHLKESKVYGPGPPTEKKSSDTNFAPTDSRHRIDKKSPVEDSSRTSFLSEDKSNEGIRVKRKSSDETGCYGPVLPSQYKSSRDADGSDESSRPGERTRTEDSDFNGGSPLNRILSEEGNVYGPILPSSPKKSKENTAPSAEVSSCYGPALPAHKKFADGKEIHSRKSPSKTTSSTENLSGENSALSPSQSESVSTALRVSSNSSSIHIESSDKDSFEDDCTYGPAAPSLMKSSDETNIYGPCLPREEESSPEIDDTYGPSLPPQNKPSGTCNTYGPSLPPSNLSKEDISSSLRDDLVEEDSDNSESDTFGPLLPGSSLNHAQILLERRAQLLREQALSKDQNSAQVNQREEWMLELPTKLGSGLGLQGARSFRSKPVPVMDSSWTDTPAYKERKQALAQVEGDKKESKKDVKNDRDEKMAKYAKSSNKRSDASLLKLHQEKLAKERKKAEKEGKKAERKPFSREDLGTPQLSKAQKHDIYKRAQQLDSRFSSGRSKYL